MTCVCAMAKRPCCSMGPSTCSCSSACVISSPKTYKLARPGSKAITLALSNSQSKSMLSTAMSFPLYDATGLLGARFLVLMHMPLGTLLREIHGAKDHAHNRHRHEQQEQDTHIQAPCQCLVRFVAERMRPGSPRE